MVITLYIKRVDYDWKEKAISLGENVMQDILQIADDIELYQLFPASL